MPKTHKPRKGSLQFWPRKRASRIYPKIRSWTKQNKILGFAGYKVGMTHIGIIDNSNATTKGLLISCPVTVIECPPLKSLSLRFYKKTDSGLVLISEIFSKKINKELKIKLSKKEVKVPESFDEIRLVVYTQPRLVGIGKKKPEVFEILIPNDVEAAKQFLEKEIKLADVFKEGQLVDVHAVTKGKGFQGPIKRFKLGIRQHKSEKTKRGPGSLGAWHPAKVSFRVPHAGQMGYHTRTEYNKWIIRVSNDPKEINPKGGFLHYGNVKNDYILVKGSISGPVKRLIRLSEPIRPNRKIPNQAPEIKYVNLESKQ